MRLRSTLQTLASACLVLLGAACATAGGRDTGPNNADLTVVVENHGWNDLSVYASSAGGRQRLGNVTSGRTATFRLASLSTQHGDLELYADALASSDVQRSGRLFVSAGQRVVWTIHEGRLGGDVTIR